MAIHFIERYCRTFLECYFGKDNNDSESEDLRSYGLRIVCLGNPERTVQGELVHYLRAQAVNAVSECGVTDEDARYSPDIVVFDERWEPECVIELKHYSANQGGLSTLVARMLADIERHKDAVHGTLPMLQIGLYSEIIEPVDGRSSRNPLGLYRFISSYVRGRPKRTLESATVPEALGGHMVRPSLARFSDGSANVVGRVGWILRASS